MFRNYIVLDNVFSDVDYFIKLAKKLSYHSNDGTKLTGMKLLNTARPIGKWKGYRTNPLHMEDTNWANYMNEIIYKIFNITRYDYNISSFLHYSPKKYDVSDDDYHQDEHYLFAGIVYLNRKPEKNSGTLLKIGDEVVNIENNFNRCIFYKANIHHRPENFFGNTMANSRLTLPFFIRKIQFEGTN